MWAACLALQLELECPLEALPTWTLNFEIKMCPKKQNKMQLDINIKPSGTLHSASRAFMASKTETVSFWRPKEFEVLKVSCW